MTIFFDLLKVAVGQKRCLSYTPNAEEWQKMFDMAEKQAVLGVCFKAVEVLHLQKQTPPQELLYEWIGAAESIRATNELVNKRCSKLQANLDAAGIRSSILKGQAIAKLYRNVDLGLNLNDNSVDLSMYRQSGDVDVYVDCGLKEALQFAKKNGCKDVEWDYKHLHLNVFQDTEVEIHYRVEVMLNIWKNRKLQKWFKKHEEWLFCQQEELIAPTIEFNRFYILLHIYRHFLYEGVGMRQLMDYYFVLKAQNESIIDNAQLIITLKEFAMMRFARGIMWVMQTVFGLEKEYLICEPLEREGQFILKEIMTGGNFGHYDERINKNRHGKMDTVKAVCKHNWHLIQHYPSEVIWPPIWFVCHKCWKITMRRQLIKIIQ